MIQMPHDNPPTRDITPAPAQLAPCLAHVDGWAINIANMRDAVAAVISAAAAGEPRITLTLPVLLGAGTLALHIEGEEKRRVLEEALAAGEADELPIRYVLRNRTDLQIYWAP